MPKTSITDYSPDPLQNLDVNGASINPAESYPQDAHKGLSAVMSHIAKVNNGTTPLSDSVVFADPADATKRVRIDANNVTPGETRVLVMGDTDIDLSQLATLEVQRSAPFHAHILNASNRAVITDNNDGTITVQPVDIQYRIFDVLKLGEIVINNRTFAVAANKTYHLRLDAPGTGAAIPAATFPHGKLRLVDVENGTYNPGALAENHAAFDGTFDDILLARIAPGVNTVSAIPAMTSNNSGGVTVSSSSTLSGTYPAWKAFDGGKGPGSGDASSWISQNPSVYPEWLKIVFGSAKRIGAFAITARDAAGTQTLYNSPRDFTLEGSNDGNNWTAVKSLVGYNYWSPTGAITRYFEVPFGDRGAYAQYQLTITKNVNVSYTGSPGFVSVGELELFEENSDIEITPLANRNDIHKDDYQQLDFLASLNGMFRPYEFALDLSRTAAVSVTFSRVNLLDTTNMDYDRDISKVADRYGVTGYVIVDYPEPSPGAAALSLHATA